MESNGKTLAVLVLSLFLSTGCIEERETPSESETTVSPASLPILADGFTVDLWESFPDNQGDNGFYAYGYAADTDAYWLLSDCDSFHFCRPEETRWRNPNVRRLNAPWVGLSPSGTRSNSRSPEDGVLAWVVPQTGYYQISGIFEWRNSSCAGGNAYIKHGAQTLLSYLLTGGATQNVDTGPLLLNAGDSIYFGANANNVGSFSECDDDLSIDGQIQRISIPEECGTALKSSCGYEFTLGQGSDKTETIQLSNPGDVARSATLEILNPYPDELIVTVAGPNPVTVEPGATVSVPIELSAAETSIGLYDNLLLKITVSDEGSNGAGLALVADTNGWIDKTTNDLRIQGAWYTTLDSNDGEFGNSTIERIGQCASGTIDQVVANEEGELMWNDIWGASVGFSLCSTDNDDDPPGMTYTLSECVLNGNLASQLTGIRFKVSGDIGDSPLRLEFNEWEPDDPYSAYVPFTQADLDAGPVVACIADAHIFWDADQPAHIDDVNSVNFLLPGIDTGAYNFDFCVENIEAITADSGICPVVSTGNEGDSTGEDDGSVFYSGISVRVVEPGAPDLPDLQVSAKDISFDSNGDGTVTLTAMVYNMGSSPVADISVNFFEFDSPLGSSTIAEIPARAAGMVSVTIPMDEGGDHLIQVVVDPLNAVSELDETNNEASAVASFGGAPLEGGILVTGSLPAKVPAGSLFSLSGHAVYAIAINGVLDTSYRVKGASVQIVVESVNGGNTWAYGGLHSDVNGVFSARLEAPMGLGEYRLTMTITDNTFTGSRELMFSVVEPMPVPPPGTVPAAWGGTGYFVFDLGDYSWVWESPPTVPLTSIPQSDLWVYSEDIHFSNNHPEPDATIDLFAEIHYWASNTTIVAQNVPVNFYATLPGSPKTLIGQTIIPMLSVGNPDNGSRFVYTTWRNPGAGIFIIEVEIVPSFTEQHMLNNAATRAIAVGASSSAFGAVAGQVRGPFGGLAGVQMDLLDENDTVLVSEYTDATGTYFIDQIPAGNWSVRVNPPDGYFCDIHTKSVTVTSGEVSTADFVLTLDPENEDDTDGDGVPDSEDGCPEDGHKADPGVCSCGIADTDTDGDSIVDCIDNCHDIFNPDQSDSDADGSGDVCDELNDEDGDGVSDDSDICEGTDPSEITDPDTGCSLDQLCPCEGPLDSAKRWNNHGEYVNCVAHISKYFLGSGLITKDERSLIQSEAARSDCGKERRCQKPKPIGICKGPYHWAKPPRGSCLFSR